MLEAFSVHVDRSDLVSESGPKRSFVVATPYTVLLECKAEDRRTALSWAKTNLKRLRFESLLEPAAQVSLVDEPFPVLERGNKFWSIPVSLVSKVTIDATSAEHAVALVQRSGEKVLAWRGPCQFNVVLDDSRDIEVKETVLPPDSGLDNEPAEDSSAPAHQGMS